MKEKFKNLLLTFLLMLVASITTSCDQLGLKTQTTDNTSVVTVEDKIVCPFDPEFTTTEQVMEFQQKLVEDYFFDSVMVSMPDHVLLNVASVCEKKYSKFKRREIVREYMTNKDIYNNIPTKTTTVKTDAVTEEPLVTLDKKEREVLVEYKDTSISGKKYRMEKRLTEYENGD